MEMTKMSFNIAYKKKNSYYIVIGKFICFIGFARFVFAETKWTFFGVSIFSLYNKVFSHFGAFSKCSKWVAVTQSF